MDQKVILQQLEFYSNAIIGFFVLQGLTFCYKFGSDKVFNETINNHEGFAIGLFVVFMVIMLFGLLANVLISNKLAELNKELEGLVKKIYLGKAFVIALFGLFPGVVLLLFVII